VYLKVSNHQFNFKEKVPFALIILNPNLVTFSCIGILYRGLDEWPMNTEIPGMALLFVE
jgi:hypothetical protein